MGKYQAVKTARRIHLPLVICLLTGIGANDNSLPHALGTVHFNRDSFSPSIVGYQMR